MKSIYKILFLFVLIFISEKAFADYNSLGLCDSAEIRRNITDSWFIAPLNDVRTKNSEIRLNSIGQKFQIRMEERVDQYAIIVSPESFVEMDYIVENEKKTVNTAVYPEGSRGSWILFRDKKTGNPVKIQFYFSSNPELYLEFWAKGKKTYVDLIVFSSYLSKAVPIGVPFSRLYSSSFEEILRLTKFSLPWDKVLVSEGLYHDTFYMITLIRSYLPKIDFAEDVCYNHENKLTFITTGTNKKLLADDEELVLTESKRLSLSGPGFIKWIADGIVEPFSGKATEINRMASPTLRFYDVGKLGSLSQVWNMTFTLDWCRNLALKAYEVRSSTALDYNYENFGELGIDVNYNYFVSSKQNGNLVETNGYLKDCGYKIEHIKSLLYVLGITEPSYFYFAAIRQSSKIKPDELVFNNCAVLFPYFDKNGRFSCVVFEMGREIPLDEFISKNKNNFIHLERVKATEYFSPYNPE